MLIQPNPRIGYLPTLDGWRAIAIALVLFDHTQHVGPSEAVETSDWVERFLNGIAHIGYFGVRIFFGISGFLICSRLIDEYRASGRISLKGFYVRRFFRIVPPLAAMMLVLLVLSYAGAIYFPLHLWVAGLLFAGNYFSFSGAWNISHLWSLAVEEHFYLLFPGLLVLIGVRRGLWLAIGAAFCVIVWRAIAFKLLPYWNPKAYFWFRTDIVADGLMWGAAVAFLCASPLRGRLISLLRPTVWWAMLIGLILSGLLCLAQTDHKVRMVAFTAQAIIIPLLIAGTVLWNGSVAGRVLEWKPMKVVGKLSYSIYLWQQLFLPPALSPLAGLSTLQQFPLNLVAIAGCAVASYYIIELPLMRLGHRLARPTSPGREELAGTSRSGAG